MLLNSASDLATSPSTVLDSCNRQISNFNYQSTNKANCPSVITRVSGCVHTAVFFYLAGFVFFKLRLGSLYGIKTHSLFMAKVVASMENSIKNCFSRIHFSGPKVGIEVIFKHAQRPSISNIEFKAFQVFQQHCTNLAEHYLKLSHVPCLLYYYSAGTESIIKFSDWPLFNTHHVCTTSIHVLHHLHPHLRLLQPLPEPSKLNRYDRCCL